MVFMSGIGRDLELSEVVSPNDDVYVVRVVGSGTVKIKEMIKPVAKIDPTLADFMYYRVEVVEVLYASSSISGNAEQWTYLFPSSDAATLKTTRNSAGKALSIGDQFFVLDSEQALYSTMYYVQDLRKIVYYNNCQDLASTITNGASYIFVGSRSIKNGVYYGNIGLGLFPNSTDVRQKILTALHKYN